MLVLGATGGVGGAIARALADHGWTVRAMVRDIAKAKAAWKTPVIPEFVAGDAMKREDVIQAATNGGAVDVIVHAVNPPGYRNWDKVVLPMIDNTIAAASAAEGARILLPGTVYNYNPVDTPVIDETTPQNAITRKGKIRIALEKRLADATSEVPSVIVRAGDFYGPNTRASWFAQAMITPGKPVRKVTSMAAGVPHAYAYLPDLAESFAQLLDRSDSLRPHEVVQFEGTWDADGRTMLDTIRKVVGRDLPQKAFPWWLMRLLAPFGGFPKEALEIEPVWRHPMRPDNGRLVELLGQEPRTPIATAIEHTLINMGCLAETSPSSISLTA
ncbi:NAD-dependent epimerase/dehydratase family protein [Aestuariibius sp. 2305UL40-4]|uniref:NAD-dependent epimerase/dehydratase family protein n=1 Tax=Aestuariibius violaceus TaxID=3234132 RepID=UPI00345E1DAD